MIVYHTRAGDTLQSQFPGGQFKTDEFNNLCILVNNRCVKVFAVNTWLYVEVETDG